jgi:Domain of unknown function (DUF4349)
MKRLLIAVLLITMLTIPSIACAGEPEYQMSEPAPPMDVTAESGFSVGMDKAGGSGDVYYDNDSAAENVERMIVRNGDMSLVVDDVMQTRDDIAALAETSGGYTVSSHVWESRDELRGRISIRVPDENFDSIFSALRDMAIKVTSETSSSQDVTEEYIDLQARLGNAEATEAQYLALLDEAKTVEDTMRIYEALSRTRQQIEQLEGRIQYLEMTASTSLISVNLEPAATLVAGSWNVSETFKNAVRGLTNFGQWLAGALIWLLIFSPVWGAITWLTVWLVRRKRKKTA